MKSEAPNNYIFAPNRVPSWSQWKATGAMVTRIIVGTRNSPMAIGRWPEDILDLRANAKRGAPWESRAWALPDADDEAEKSGDLYVRTTRGG